VGGGFLLCRWRRCDCDLRFSASAALIGLSIVLMAMIASTACSAGEVSYWKGMQLVASLNPTGETFFGQIFVLPALAVATLYSWFLALTWILGGREWPRKRWFAFCAVTASSSYGRGQSNRTASSPLRARGDEDGTY
jgi:hypothetical protein